MLTIIKRSLSLLSGRFSHCVALIGGPRNKLTQGIRKGSWRRCLRHDTLDSVVKVVTEITCKVPDDRYTTRKTFNELCSKSCSRERAIVPKNNRGVGSGYLFKNARVLLPAYNLSAVRQRIQKGCMPSEALGYCFM
jgi:hypothetical protein